MVVNKDTRREKTGAELTMRVFLSFHPSVQSVQCLRRNSGKVETIAVGKYYAFELSGGTGDLFRFEGSITASSAFVGLEPVELPGLVRSDPPDGGIAGRLSNNNELQCTFDRDARNVCAQIRRLDTDGDLVEADTADRMTRNVSDEGRVLVYCDVKGLLVSDVTYQVDLHWVDAAPLWFTVIQGDVDGKGGIGEADTEALLNSPGK